MELLLSELDERDSIRRNFYLKSAKFDVVKTFKNYTFEEIKFSNSLSVYEIINTYFVPKRETI
ncbi:hypothetical protein FACS1894105_07410 [Clostridia bacterium]|nr:hypothetical protein FACS1894105_07410 [Clostridia bacterium]